MQIQIRARPNNRAASNERSSQCLASKGGRFLDVGSGTGALAAAVLEGVEDCTVIGIEGDPFLPLMASPPAMAVCREQAKTSAIETPLLRTFEP